LVPVILLLLEGVAVNTARRQDLEAGAESVEFVYKETPQGALRVLADFPAHWSASDERPAIVFFFGGAFRWGSVEQFAPQAQYLASRGMVALRADYRVEERHGVSPDKCVEDARSAMRWIRANAAELGVNPQKVISSGGSAGGHLAACVATTPGLDARGDDLSISPKPCAMVLFNPVLDFVGFENLVERVASREIAEGISPTRNLSKDAPPAIIFYGTEDRMLSMGEAYCARATALGVRAEMYTAQGQPHGFFNRPPWREKTLYEADRFLASLGCLEGEPTLAVPAEGGELKRWSAS
jgi:acetyl esterase